MLVDDWKKSLIYVTFAVPMFTKHLLDTFTVLAGYTFIVCMINEQTRTDSVNIMEQSCNVTVKQVITQLDSF